MNGTNGNGNDWRAQAFTRLRGNVKGVFDDAVGPLTMYVGANQSGKSGRLIGIRYGLRGVEGWSLGVHGSSIAELAPAEHERFFSELSGPSGTAAFQVLQENKKWREPEKKPKFTGQLEQLTPEQRRKTLPLVSMSELLNLGPDRGRRELMLRFGDAYAVPRPVALQPEQKKLWEDTLAKVTGLLTKKDAETGEMLKPEASEVLVGMSKAFNSLKLAAGKNMSGLRAALNERKSMLVEQAAGSELLPRLREEYKQAQLWESVSHLRGRLAQIEAEKARLRIARQPFDEYEQNKERRQAQFKLELEAYQAPIDAVRARIDALEVEIADHRDKLAWGTNLLKALEHICDGRCPLCRNPFNQTEALAFVRPAVELRKQQYEDACTRRQEAKVEEGKLGLAHMRFCELWNQQDNQQKQRFDAFLQEVNHVLRLEKEVQAALAATSAPTAYSGPTSTELKSQIDALEAADVARKTLEQDAGELRELENKQALAKGLEADCKVLSDALIERVQETAESTVNKYMPDGLRAVLDLGKNTWRVIDRTGTPRSRHTMCGFEENALVPALAAAYTEGSPLRILTLDDEDLKGIGFENVPRFFGALKRAVANGWLTQVFVAGNRFEPALPHLQGDGWTIIRTDAPAQRPAPQPISDVAPSFSDLYTADGAPRI